MKTSDFSDAYWDILLAFIQEGQVVPVIGQELSDVIDRNSGQRIRFNDWLGDRLTETLGLQKGDTLNAVVRRILADHGTTRDLYPAIRNIILRADLEPPPSLVKLASIRNFKGWLTTSYDGLLSKALKLVRGSAPAEFSYCPKRFEDLPPNAGLLDSELVYYVFGRLSAIARYAVAEEDILEWITALQSDAFAPEKLMSEVQECHLLLIGINYPDWLGRFFLRTAKRRRLSEGRDWSEFIVVPDQTRDKELLDFLRSVSRNTIVVEGFETPSAFVDELHDRWHSMQGKLVVPGFIKANEVVRFQPPRAVMDEGAVFVSYSRDDLPRVKRLKAGFDERGIPTWFDLERLGTGDDYSNKILRNIRKCSYFIPVISKNALERNEAFFYREWSWALDRRQGIGPGVPFILPILVDEVSLDHPKIPNAFRGCDIASLPEGQVDQRFINRLTDLLSLSHV